MTGRRGMFGAFAALALVGVGATALSGCVVDSGRRCSTEIVFSWSVSDTAGNPLSCAQAGAETVEIEVGGATATFLCGAGSGVTSELPPATYNVGFRLLDRSGNVLSAAAPKPVGVPACGINLGNIPFTIAACNPQVVSLQWDIVKRISGAGLSCAQAAATVVRLTMGAMEAEFACDAHAGVSPPVAAGTYDTMVELVGVNRVLASTGRFPVPVPRCNGVALEPITFPTD